MSDDKEQIHDLVKKNFYARQPTRSAPATRGCGSNCGPCSCPGGQTCTPAVGTSTESIGYAGGVAGDMTA